MPFTNAPLLILSAAERGAQHIQSNMMCIYILVEHAHLKRPGFVLELSYITLEYLNSKTTFTYFKQSGSASFGKYFRE